MVRFDVFHSLLPFHQLVRLRSSPEKGRKADGCSSLAELTLSCNKGHHTSNHGFKIGTRVNCLTLIHSEIAPSSTKEWWLWWCSESADCRRCNSSWTLGYHFKRQESASELSTDRSAESLTARPAISSRQASRLSITSPISRHTWRPANRSLRWLCCSDSDPKSDA
jgi:hypothetical protein